MPLFSNGYEPPKVSPGLNMQHGFIRLIQKHQENRLHNDSWQELNSSADSDGSKSSNNTAAASLDEKRRFELPGRGKQLFCVDKREKKSVMEKTMTSQEPGSRLDDEVDLTMQDVNLENYLVEAQPFIKDALESPSSISGRQLQMVAEVIINRAWEDRCYYDTAAKMCQVIFKKENQLEANDIIPANNFRNGVTTTCSLLMKKQEVFRKHSLEGFMSFVKFLAKAYTYLICGSGGLQMLNWNLYDALHILCTPECLGSFDMVELLHSTLQDVGPMLENENSNKMMELVNKIRDALLDPSIDEFSRGALMEILELRASKWKLPVEVASYYIECTAEVWFE